MAAEQVALRAEAVSAPMARMLSQPTQKSGFTWSVADPSLYLLCDHSEVNALLLVHVEDMLIGGDAATV